MLSLQFRPSNHILLIVASGAIDGQLDGPPGGGMVGILGPSLLLISLLRRRQTSSDRDRTVVPRRASSAAGGARAMEY